MWREGEGKRRQPAKTPGFAGILGPGRAENQWIVLPDGTNRRGRCVKVPGSGRQHWLRSSLARAAPFEQHAPLESAGAHDGKTRQDLFPLVADIRRHQDRLFCRPAWKPARLGRNGLVQEDAAIKRLMVGTDHGKPGIGIEMIACDKRQPHRQIGQLRKALVLFGISNEPTWIDKNLASVEARMQDIAEHFGRIGRPPFRRQDVDTNGTTKFPVNVDPEIPGIGRFVEAIGDAQRL
jgi:hypothetical protein